MKLKLLQSGQKFGLLTKNSMTTWCSKKSNAAENLGSAQGFHNLRFIITSLNPELLRLLFE